VRRRLRLRGGSRGPCCTGRQREVMSLRRETMSTLPAEPTRGIEPRSPVYKTGASPSTLRGQSAWRESNPRLQLGRLSPGRSDTGTECVESDELCSARTIAGRFRNPLRVSFQLEYPAGIGPAPTAWQAVMQPLTPWVHRGRSENRTRDNSLCRRAPCRLGDPAVEEAGRVELPAPEGAAI
jgi:hypothetical protein